MPGGNDFIRVAFGDHREREHSRNFFDGTPDRILKIAFKVSFHQVGDHLSVGLGHKFVTLELELMLQREVIFDDAVVNYDKIAAAITMGVGVFFSGAAVGGPTCVADPIRAIEGINSDCFFKVAEFTRCPPDRELMISIVNGDAGRIVSTIFKPPQPI